MTVDISQLLQDSNNAYVGNGSYLMAQSFTPRANTIFGVSLYKISCVNHMDLTVSIRTNNAGVPSATVLTSKTYPAAEWEAFGVGLVYVPLTQVALTPGTLYWIHLGFSGGGTDYFGYYSSSVYTGGTYLEWNGSSWTNKLCDLTFKTHFLGVGSQAIITG